MTCVRDDGPCLVEWVAHHLAAGFDRMLIFSHECTDGSDALLEALGADPRITHVPFQPEGKKTVQWQALRHIQSHDWYTSATWALFFDCDEFLCAPRPLPEIIDTFSDDLAFDALVLPWRLYGASGHETRTAGLTPERFLRAAPLDLHFPLGHLFKTLHRPQHFRQPGVHRPRLKKAKPTVWCGPDGQALPEAFSTSDEAISLYGALRNRPLIWLNHYSLRSKEEFMVKRARGLPNHTSRDIDLTYWVERNWNTVEAPEILPMMPATRKTCEELLALPDVKQAHEACQTAHAARRTLSGPDADTGKPQPCLSSDAGTRQCAAFGCGRTRVRSGAACCHEAR
jgi:hypothetical protein